jgi:phosphatidate phosphatase PAH1
MPSKLLKMKYLVRSKNWGSPIATASMVRTIEESEFDFPSRQINVSPLHSFQAGSGAKLNSFLMSTEIKTAEI